MGPLDNLNFNTYTKIMLADTPFMRRLAAKDGMTHGRTSESRLIKTLGGRAQPGSGNMDRAKGDMKLQTVSYKFRMECKATKNLTLAVEAGWLTKIAHEAASDASIPALTISFVDPQGKPRTKNSEWVAVPLWFFREITGNAA